MESQEAIRQNDKKEETRLGLTYEQFVKKYLENDPYEFMAHIDAMWASLPVDP